MSRCTSNDLLKLLTKCQPVFRSQKARGKTCTCTQQSHHLQTPGACVAHLKSVHHICTPVGNLNITLRGRAALGMPQWLHHGACWTSYLGDIRSLLQYITVTKEETTAGWQVGPPLGSDCEICSKRSVSISNNCCRATCKVSEYLWPGPSCW